jgi:hypothetical protein
MYIVLEQKLLTGVCIGNCKWNFNSSQDQARAAVFQELYRTENQLS